MLESAQQAHTAPEATTTGSSSPQPAGSATKRLVYTLALLPIVPSLSILGGQLLQRNLFTGVFDELRWFHLLFSTLWVFLIIAIWRRAIVWTLGRKWLTAIVSMIPFAQVVYAQPLWNTAGCGDDELLRMGQHEITVGLWVWCCIWVWWVWEKRTMNSDKEKTPRRISSPAVRVAASIATLPFLAGLYFVIGVALDDLAGLTDLVAMSFAYALSAIVAVILWIRIWGRTVSWSPAVVRRTVALALICLALPIALHFLFWRNASNEFLKILLACLPVIGWGIWMAGTVAVWPMAITIDGLSTTDPRCLSCGYLLTGLTRTRCPECGDEPTLDRLWAGNAGMV